MRNFNREKDVDSREQGEHHVERDPEIPGRPQTVPRGTSLQRSQRSQIGHFGAMEGGRAKGCAATGLSAGRPACRPRKPPWPRWRRVRLRARPLPGPWLSRSLHLLIYLHLSLSCCRAAIMMGRGGGVLYLYLDPPLRHARPRPCRCRHHVAPCKSTTLKIQIVFICNVFWSL